MKELGEAINSSLAGSETISQMLLQIKREGYDVYLVLEATSDAQFDADPIPDELVRMPHKGRHSDWALTAHDARFLRSLHIRVDDAA